MKMAQAAALAALTTAQAAVEDAKRASIRLQAEQQRAEHAADLGEAPASPAQVAQAAQAADNLQRAVAEAEAAREAQQQKEKELEVVAASVADRTHPSFAPVADQLPDEARSRHLADRSVRDSINSWLQGRLREATLNEYTPEHVELPPHQLHHVDLPLRPSQGEETHVQLPPHQLRHVKGPQDRHVEAQHVQLPPHELRHVSAEYRRGRFQL